MRHEIEHDLDMATARIVARHAVGDYHRRFEKYDFSSEWIDDDHCKLVFRMTGREIDGGLEVQEGRIVFTLDVPFVFRVFSGKAIEMIESETRKWIDRAKAGELDLTG